jgi:predicted DNA-binding transcriptional regulator AlpA
MQTLENGEKLLIWNEVSKLTNLSRGRIVRMVFSGEFPEPDFWLKRNSLEPGNCIFWRKSKIDKWLGNGA